MTDYQELKNTHQKNMDVLESCQKRSYAYLFAAVVLSLLGASMVQSTFHLDRLTMVLCSLGILVVALFLIGFEVRKGGIFDVKIVDTLIEGAALEKTEHFKEGYFEENVIQYVQNTTVILRFLPFCLIIGMIVIRSGYALYDLKSGADFYVALAGAIICGMLVIKRVFSFLVTPYRQLTHAFGDLIAEKGVKV